MSAIHLDAAAISRLFPFHFAFDRDHRVISMGSSLAKLSLSVNVGSDWRDAFRLTHPAATASSFDAISESLDSLFILYSNMGDIELKGEMMLDPQQEVLIFLGIPAIRGVHQLKSAGLKLRDFARHDQTCDYMFMLQVHHQTEQELKHSLHDLERAYSDLKESEQNFHQLVEHIDELFWITDPNKNSMLYISPAYESIWGRDCESLYASPKNWLETIHSDDRQRILKAAMEKQILGTYDEEYRIERPNGEVRWIRDRAYPVQNQAGVVYRVVGVAEDITDRKQHEQSRLDMQAKIEHMQRLESLGVLAGGIAHDFNNILTAILGNAALAERKALSKPMDTQRHLSNIVASSEKAADLCKQMLAYSGKGKFIVKALDLSAMVEEISRLLEVSISKNVVLKYHLTDNLSAVEADAAQLQQVIMNLVINASDAIGDKSGVISIGTGIMHADTSYLAGSWLDDALPAGRYIFLEVSDTGCGMDKETQKKIFEPFFTTKFTGHGLGMSAVLGIIRGHHGAIKLYSEPGCGSTFKMLLPVSDQQPEAVSKQPVSGGAWRGSGVVLIVDDEEAIRKTAAMMLEEMGFATLAAVDGEDGVRVYRQHQGEIVAVLLDMTMPKMDGKTCYTELKRINSDVQVVLSSGYNEQEATSRFAGKGLAGFIQKPYRPEALALKMEWLFHC